MATAQVDRLTELAPGRTIENRVLADSPAEFGVITSKFGLQKDYLILVKHGFSGNELFKLFLRFSAFPHADDISGIKDDLGNAAQAIEMPHSARGKKGESEYARVKRLHETDPVIGKTFIEFRADSERRWNMALSTTEVTPAYVADYGAQPTDPESIKGEPMQGLITWRRTLFWRRSLRRVEAFRAAAHMGLGIDDKADLFLGNTIAALIGGGEFIDKLPVNDLTLRQGRYHQIRTALQGAFLASVPAHNRELYSGDHGLFRALEKNIEQRLK